MKRRSIYVLATLQLSLLSLTAQESPSPGASRLQQQPSRPSAVSAQASPLRDGAHDFDFLIGNWKAHVHRLPDRLVGSTTWIEYDGISNHKKILDSNANFEEFEVDNPEKHLHIKGQTLRLYNPDSHQWSIYTLDLDKGVLNLPPVVGQFTGNRGEFYDQEQYKGLDPGALRLVEYLAEIGADGTVVLARWRKNVGNKLDLRIDSIARLLRRRSKRGAAATKTKVEIKT
jgi:hypothetical protein